jgi:hypothetical protein
MVFYVKEQDQEQKQRNRDLQEIKYTFGIALEVMFRGKVKQKVS